MNINVILRIIEEKIAIYGTLESPTSLIADAQNTKRNIDELEQRIRRRIRHINSDGRLYTNEEVDEIFQKIIDIRLKNIHIKNLKDSKIPTIREEMNIKPNFKPITSYKKIAPISVISAIVLDAVIQLYFGVVASAIFGCVFFGLLIIYSIYDIRKGISYRDKYNNKIENDIAKTKENIRDLEQELSKIYPGKSENN